jgi:uncharacterized protein (TIGR02246 family)
MALRDEIEAQGRKFEAAYNSGDMAAFARLYTEDARVLPPDAPVVKGRDGARGVFEGARAAGFQRVRLETEEVTPLGADAAVEIGHGALIPAQGDEVRVKYAVVWRREGGEWRLAVDTWNSLPS